jgi:ABC-type Fe3+-hydroxamate transport system substrate-binding protein
LLLVFLQLSRRRPVLARTYGLLCLLLAWTLGGCAATSPGESTADQPAVRASEADPGVVVTLDDFASLNVLALGVTPDLAYDAFSYPTTAAIMAERKVETKPL